MGRMHPRSLAAILLFAVFLLAVYFPVWAENPVPAEMPPAVGAVVDAERAFARLSLEKGMKDAFLANLAADAVVFRPGPVPAVAWFRDRPAATGRLSWEPDFAAASAAGDLGYTSGPWEYRESGADSGAHGHYVSLWRRQADGTLRVELDTGVRHEAPTGAVKLAFGLDPNAGRTTSGVPADATEAGLLDADRRIGAGIASGASWVDAWLAHAATDVRVYRVEHLPVIGKEAASALLRSTATTCVWKPVAAGVSSAGDLGYTYGSCEFQPAGAVPDSLASATYLRIWRRRLDGGREIVLDLNAPLPPPKKKS